MRLYSVEKYNSASQCHLEKVTLVQGMGMQYVAFVMQFCGGGLRWFAILLLRLPG